LAKTFSRRRVATLWFIASGLALIAAGVTYARAGEIRWSLLAATVFLAAMGFRSLRRSRSDII